MTIERAHELIDEARQHQNRDELRKAGDVHTQGAHEFAGITSRSFPEPGGLQNALAHLLAAATCYRVAGDSFRVQNRCELGSVLAEDRFEYVMSLDVRQNSFEDLRGGVWLECIGDLRTIAQREDADEAYDRAISIYESAGEWESVMGEKEHSRLFGFYRSIKSGLGIKIPSDAPEAHAMGITFTEWVEYKRDSLPDLLEQLEQQGTWPHVREDIYE